METDYVGQLLLYINDKNLVSVLQMIADNENLNKTYAKASSSGGRYHKESSNGIGGLYNHTCEMLEMAKIMLAPLITMHLVLPREVDIVNAAIILHDGWKYQNQNFAYQMFTTKDHPYVGYLALRKYANEHSDINRIAELVRFHQSAWSGDDTNLVKEKILSDALLQIVVYCDMLSSRKNVKVEID